MTDRLARPKAVVAGLAVMFALASLGRGFPISSAAAASPSIPSTATVAPSVEVTGSPDTTVTPPPVSPDATVTLLAVGDLMCHSAQLKAARTRSGYNFHPSFKPVVPTILAADIAVGNLETTLSDRSYSGYPAFKTPFQYASAAKTAGFDVLTTANNHSLDGGAKGVRFTAAYLDKIGVAHTGTDNDGPAVVTHDGVRIAFVAYTYATNGIRSPYGGAVNRIDLRVIKKAIKAARAKADIVVVYLHLGTEYQSKPEASTRALCRALIDNGADLVLGSHPHVVRPLEKYKGKYIVYSMGNFLSAQTKSYTDLGVATRVVVVRRAGVVRVVSLKVLPLYRDRTSGAGTSTYRILLIEKALAAKDRLTSHSDMDRMRNYRTYCQRMYRGYI